MTHQKSLIALLLAGSLAGLAACDRQADRDDAVIVDTDGAAAAAREAADDAMDATRRAADRTAEAASELGDRAGAAMETMDVKAALIADQTVEADEIDVDTNHETKTVVLKGSVPTTAQKDEAETIARAKAPGYAIDNRLLVVPGTR
ncbi:MAG: BON domain-containing protein [Vicinamibacterales bacterium]